MPSKYTSPLALFRGAAIAEGLLLLALMAAVPLAGVAGSPLILSVVAVAFGLVLVVYLTLAFDLWVVLEWSALDTAFVAVAAVVPTGGFFVERWLRAQQAELEAASEFVKAHHLIADEPAAERGLEREHRTEITLV